MKKIGLRNIKTAISVFICLSIYFVIILIAHIFNDSWASNFRKATQLYTPFFACLATAYSISTDREKSLAQGKLRLSASIIGGLFGLLVVAIYQSSGHDWPFQHISATGNATSDLAGLFETGWLAGVKFISSDVNGAFLASFILPVILTVLSVIFVIWFCNLIKRPQCSFIAVLTLTAVMSSLGTNPVIYGPNRILSTVIGILVALLVNLFKFPHHKNHKVAFIFGIDGVYTKDYEEFSGINQYKMNNLIDDGANVTLFTTRTPSTLLKLISQTKITNPVICMSGAAVYDFKKKEYLYHEDIDNNVSLKLSKIFNTLNVHPFVNVIKDDLLYTYVDTLENDAKKLYASNRKNAPYISFNHVEELPKNDILYYVVIDTNQKILEIKSKLLECGIDDDLLILTYDVYEINNALTGYSYLKIYSKKILELNFLKNSNDIKLYGFGVHEYDSILFKNVYESFTTNNAPMELKQLSNNILKDTSDKNLCLLNEAFKLYHKK